VKELKHVPVKYQVGIPNWDLQHAELMALHHEAAQTTKKAKALRQKHIIKVVEEIQQYSKKHFEYEENKMNRANFPEADITEHLKEHSIFTKEMDELKRSLEVYEDFQVEMLTSFIKDWFLNHIHTIDRKLADFILQQEKKSDLD
jgi:hemerythrin-like metal-binding protein